MTLSAGIVGCGFIGGALRRWFEEHNPAVVTRVSDPPKGFNDDLSDCDAIFVSIHLPTENDGTQDLTLLKRIIASLPDKPVFIRTTVLPGTTDALAGELGRRLYFMPEFLTERTAYADFCSQPMIFTGEVELLTRLFIGKRHIVMSSLEAEIAKYAHNVFGALKVTYFNGVYEICEKMGADYAKVRQGVRLSGYINDPHTQVPGPDGKFGYGGKCFPKDVNAFTKLFEDCSIHDLLRELAPLNARYRGKEEPQCR